MKYALFVLRADWSIVKRLIRILFIDIYKWRKHRRTLKKKKRMNQHISVFVWPGYRPRNRIIAVQFPAVPNTFLQNVLTPGVHRESYATNSGLFSATVKRRRVVKLTTHLNLVSRPPMEPYFLSPIHLHGVHENNCSFTLSEKKHWQRCLERSRQFALVLPFVVAGCQARSEYYRKSASKA